MYNSLITNFVSKEKMDYEKYIQSAVLRERQQGENGIVPVMGRVTINGSVAQFSCKQTIAKEPLGRKGQPGEREEQGGAGH